MSAIAIVLIGMAVVVGGVLFLRLHAFLALILGALVVAWLTPMESIRNEAVRPHVFEEARRHAEEVSGESQIQWIELRREGRSRNASHLLVLDKNSLELVGIVENMSVPAAPVVTVLEIRLPGHNGRQPTDEDAFVHPIDYDDAESLASKSAIHHVTTGFGNTTTKIGILIAMAAIIGMCLLKSGAAERIVTTALNVVGEKRAGIAFTASGFTLAIPVFFDTVFYLLIPLGKALRRKTGRNYTLYIMAIVLGGTMAHSLVPPTPGPLFVAAELGVDLGAMMVGGCVLGILTVLVGYQYARWANRRWDIPLRDDDGHVESNADEKSNADETVAASLGDAKLPPLWLALLPIVLPVLMIGGRTAIGMAIKASEDPSSLLTGLKPVFDTLGDKNIALIIGAAIAMITLVIYKRTSRKQLAESVQAALMSGGVIILITSAGGAFGHVLRQTDIAAEIKTLVEIKSFGLWLLPAAFLITTIVRTAQGSATVAMITAVGIIAPIVGPLVASGDLPFHPVYLALAIGCGSKPISWMNDSGFWVIGKMSGMTEAETLKTSSMVMIVMAVTGLILLMGAATVMPLAMAK